MSGVETDLLRLWKPGVGDKGLFYDARQTPWKQFWPELLARIPSAQVSPVRLPRKEFQIVNELPPNYPAAVRSTELDAGMRAAVHLEDLSFVPMTGGRTSGDLSFCLRLSVVAPPSAFAGRLEAVDPGGVMLIATSVAFQQGETRAEVFCNPSFAGNEAAFGPTRALITQGQQVRLNARLVADREQAAKTQGIDAFWDGRLDFKQPAQLVPQSKFLWVGDAKRP